MTEDKKEDKKDKVKIIRDRHGKTYFWCSCHGHMVTLWWDDGDGGDFDFDLIEMSFWDNPKSTYGWKQKLSHIWHIIRHGSPYADHIIFDSEEAELFIGVFQFYVEKAKAAKARADKKEVVYKLKKMKSYPKECPEGCLQTTFSRIDEDFYGGAWKCDSCNRVIEDNVIEKPFTPKPGVAKRYVSGAHIGESDECDCDQCIPKK